MPPKALVVMLLTAAITLGLGDTSIADTDLQLQGLREGLTKAENTIATLLRTGIIGLKDWLYWVGIPVGSPRCKYGWPRQTPKHIILLCPLYTGREVMLLVASTENYNTLLSI